MSRQVCGTCSLCGGAVTVPAHWCSILPAEPTCEQCGAVAAQHGPVIEMTRPVFTRRTFTSTGTHFTLEEEATS